eukprot:290016-Pleurochrysis_carterae.AAC.13
MTGSRARVPAPRATDDQADRLAQASHPIDHLGGRRQLQRERSQDGACDGQVDEVEVGTQRRLMETANRRTVRGSETSAGKQRAARSSPHKHAHTTDAHT